MTEKIIEHEGKRYIEFDQAKYYKRRTIINILFLILLMFAIIGLVSGIVTLLKNKELLKNEPLTYVMERYNMKTCGCIGNDGVEWYSGEHGWKPNYEKGGIFKPNFTDTELIGGINLTN